MKEEGEREEWGRASVVETAARLRNEGLIVGFTSGVFDLMHAGHLDYLVQARAHCDHLIVGVNSNASVRSNKGPGRPIRDEEVRAKLVAGLKPVDSAFIFDEGNNNRNIELLKPDLYIKAGDYDESRLSSAPIVKAQGGRILLIPVKHSESSSGIIEDIHSRLISAQEKSAAVPPRPAVFLDRDGTINEEIDYLHEAGKMRLRPRTVEGLRAFAEAGYALIIVTNQPGIGLGYFTHEDFYRVNKTIMSELSRGGIMIDKIYYCPHSLAVGCRCRKPGTLLIERAFAELPLVREHSWMIGDRDSDLQAGERAGLKSLLISASGSPTGPHPRAKDLMEAAGIII
ncbi:MAG: HAD-IIIA family hydrolase [Planctomycetes bacterium]|nr:HAD-IIIA family hydrolase [Planctomycetota bacterium]